MANFNFLADGKVDMMSLNPLEMTNFEMAATLFGLAGLALTFVLSRLRKKGQPPHAFTAREVDDGASE